jgi:hypothetical protein
MDRYVKTTGKKEKHTDNAKQTDGWDKGGYFATRSRKIQKQAPKAKTQLLKGVTVYFTCVVSESQHCTFPVQNCLFSLRGNEPIQKLTSLMPFLVTDLTRLVWEAGGVVSYGWSRRSVTHVVADRLAAPKIDKELRLTGKGKSWRGFIVKPAWIVTSVQRGKKEPIAPHELISPSQRRAGDLRTMFAPRDPNLSSDKIK